MRVFTASSIALLSLLAAVLAGAHRSKRDDYGDEEFPMPTQAPDINPGTDNEDQAAPDEFADQKPLSVSDLSEALVDSRQEGNRAQLRFKPEALGYFGPRLLVGEASQSKSVARVHVALVDDNNQVVSNDAGVPAKYSSDASDFGHILDIMHDGHTFAHVLLILELQSNKAFNMHDLYFRPSRAPSNKHMRRAIFGPTLLYADQTTREYKVSSACPRSCFCKWLLNGQTVFNGPDTSIGMEFGEEDVGTRQLSYVCNTGRATRSLASLEIVIRSINADADTCTDDVRNGDETDDDCGGNSCPPCAAYQKCHRHSDCVSDHCRNGRCHSVAAAGPEPPTKRKKKPNRETDDEHGEDLDLTENENERHGEEYDREREGGSEHKGRGENKHSKEPESPRNNQSQHGSGTREHVKGDQVDRSEKPDEEIRHENDNDREGSGGSDDDDEQDEFEGDDSDNDGSGGGEKEEHSGKGKEKKNSGKASSEKDKAKDGSSEKKERSGEVQAIQGREKAAPEVDVKQKQSNQKGDEKSGKPKAETDDVKKRFLK